MLSYPIMWLGGAVPAIKVLPHKTARYSHSSQRLFTQHFLVLLTTNTLHLLRPLSSPTPDGKHAIHDVPRISLVLASTHLRQRLAQLRRNRRKEKSRNHPQIRPQYESSGFPREGGGYWVCQVPVKLSRRFRSRGGNMSLKDRKSMSVFERGFVRDAKRALCSTGRCSGIADY